MCSFCFLTVYSHHHIVDEFITKWLSKEKSVVFDQMFENRLSANISLTMIVYMGLCA